MNNINLIGRMARDIEVKTSKGGKSYGTFCLAVNRVMEKDKADFINCVAFGKTAELIAQYVKKGEMLGVTGSLQIEQYESNGEKRIAAKVMVNQIDFISGSKKEGGNSNQGTKPATKKDDFDEDEFPF